MTAQPANAAQGSQTAAAPGEAAVDVEPAAEAVRAIEAARQRLEAAAAAVASGDEAQLARAQELAAGCADDMARALWFLRRLERERGGAGR